MKDHPPIAHHGNDAVRKTWTEARYSVQHRRNRLKHAARRSIAQSLSLTGPMCGPLFGGGFGSLPDPDLPVSPSHPESGISARHLPRTHDCDTTLYW